MSRSVEKALLLGMRVNPVKLLTLAIILNIVLLPMAAWIVRQMYQSLTAVGTEKIRLEAMVGRIAYLNERLTMTARMGAVTGLPEWEERYHKIETELDDTLAKVALLSRREYGSTYGAQTKLAYSKLIEMEYLAFALVRADREEEAREIVFGKGYEDQKALYSTGLRQMSQAVHSRIQQEIRSFRHRLWQAGLLGALSLGLLLCAWSGVLLALKRHLQARRRAEAALEAEKERLVVTLGSIGDGVITTDTAGKTLFMNPMAEKLTGWPNQEAVGRPLEEIFHPINERTRKRTENPVTKTLRTGKICTLSNNTILVSRDGAERIIADSAAPVTTSNGKVIGVVLVFRDITDRKRMQDELIKAEKLESVGILAGGIAHDFNNILTAVHGNISLAKLSVSPNGEAFDRLIAAEKAACRAKDLTRQLLTFSKGGAPVKTAAPLKELLMDWTNFALRGSNVKSVLDVAEDLWQADIDEGQISQVINNLVINADQAMPDGGTIHVTAKNLMLTQVQESFPCGPGRWILVSVKDEGIGIPPDSLPRIFDPYFTTKETGVGLGLATSYATIKAHGGHIQVESSPGIGTTFTIYFPATETPREPRLRSELYYRSPRTGCRILVMDDDEIVGGLAKEILETLGYEAIVVDNGDVALEKYRKSKDQGRPFDVVIMDLTIPGGMGGKETIKVLKEYDPLVKAIVCSGYCNDPIMADYEGYGFCGVLAKPFSIHEMSQVVHRVVNSARAA